MLLRSMDAPATKVDVKNIKLDKMSKTLVENSSTLVQLIEKMREIQESQQFFSDQYEEMKKHRHSTDEEVKTLRIENQDLKDHVRKLQAESGQILSRILTTLSSMAAVNALSFKDCPVRKVRTLINW